MRIFGYLKRCCIFEPEFYGDNSKQSYVRNSHLEVRSSSYPIEQKAIIKYWTIMGWGLRFISLSLRWKRKIPFFSATYWFFRFVDITFSCKVIFYSNEECVNLSIIDQLPYQFSLCFLCQAHRISCVSGFTAKPTMINERFMAVRRIMLWRVHFSCKKPIRIYLWLKGENISESYSLPCVVFIQ